MEATALKTARKILKKEADKDASATMRISKLVTAIQKKLEKSDDWMHVDLLKGWLQSSDKFHVDGKKVSLADKSSTPSKKRQLEVGDDDNDEKSKRKSARKEKKKKKKTKSKSTSSPPSDSIDDDTKATYDKWRKDQKIVLKDTDGISSKEEQEALERDPNYLPYLSFPSALSKSSLNPLLIQQCTDVHKFERPSPIQAQCWPILLHQPSKTSKDTRRRDVVGIAETGSGKTLAFAFPAISALAEENHTLPSGSRQRRTPRMLVLAPTRELAMQSHVVIEEFGALVGLSCLVVYGGVPKYTQTNALRKGVDCVVATPGRVKDLINEGSCDLSRVSQLVLDEADRMLDMGFEEDVRFIISSCLDKDEGRQTAMFSATWPAAIQNIANEYMINPVRIYVGFEAIIGSNGENAVDDSLSANKRVTQTVEVIDDRARESRLRQLLTKYCPKTKDGSQRNRILIFALYKKEAARLERDLSRNGWEGMVTSIHGDKLQDARTRALDSFKKGTNPLLVATDVAARGLDIPNVEMVINYTFPLTIEDYVHRIGRTGRAGKTGMSVTFFQPTDKSHAGELQQVMKQADQSIPEELMNFGSTIKKKEHKLYGNFGPSGGGPMKKAVKITFDSDDE